MLERLVVGVDGSDHSYQAVEYAVDLAKVAGSKIFLLTVFRPMRMPDNTHSLIRPQLHPDPADTGLDSTARQVVEAAERWAREHGAGDVESFVRHGPPARTIAAFAKEVKASAILLGGRGLGDISAFMLGSVSQKVSHIAECTCILVK
jgi:nucleotide-binding universal stress UspA family protein